MIDQNELKKGISELWEKSLHLSKDYIQLIFNSYFKEEYLAYHIVDNKVAAVLLGIPYFFGYGHNMLKGIFIFGAATDNKFHHKGLMTDLLKDFNNKHKNDFDLTFLVPSSDLVADFFRHRGYFNSFYRLEQRFTSIHNFKNDFIVSLEEVDPRVRKLKENLFSEIKVSFFDFNSLDLCNEVYEFIKNCESKPRRSVILNHNSNDFFTYISNCQINDIQIIVAEHNGKISGIAFAKKDEMKRLKIPYLYYNDNCTFYALLSFIKEKFFDYSLSLYGASEPYSQSIIEEVYGAKNPDGSDLETLFGLFDTQTNPAKLMEPGGMVKILNYENILAFIAKYRKEIDFKLHLRDYNEPGVNDRNIYFHVKNGAVSTYPFKREGADKSILSLTTKEFSELLFRKKDSNNLILEAFGIPRLILEFKMVLK